MQLLLQKKTWLNDGEGGCVRDHRCEQGNRRGEGAGRETTRAHSGTESGLFRVAVTSDVGKVFEEEFPPEIRSAIFARMRARAMAHLRRREYAFVVDGNTHLSKYLGFCLIESRIIGLVVGRDPSPSKLVRERKSRSYTSDSESRNL